MKVVKIIGIIIIFLALIVFGGALFLADSYHIERSVLIKNTPDLIYQSISDFNKWEKWNPWNAMDPNAIHSISGNAGEPGHKWVWSGEKLGKGNLTIQEIKKFREVKSLLVFEEPQQMESMDIWKLENTSEGVNVIWSMEGKLGYPIQRWFGLMLEGMLSPDMEKGLANLKKYMEQQTSENTNNDTKSE